jgi:hypothetical protein
VSGTDFTTHLPRPPGGKFKGVRNRFHHSPSQAARRKKTGKARLNSLRHPISFLESNRHAKSIPQVDSLNPKAEKRKRKVSIPSPSLSQPTPIASPPPCCAFQHQSCTSLSHKNKKIIPHSRFKNASFPPPLRAPAPNSAPPPLSIGGTMSRHHQPATTLAPASTPARPNLPKPAQTCINLHPHLFSQNEPTAQSKPTPTPHTVFPNEPTTPRFLSKNPHSTPPPRQTNPISTNKATRHFVTRPPRTMAHHSAPPLTMAHHLRFSKKRTHLPFWHPVFTAALRLTPCPAKLKMWLSGKFKRVRNLFP